MRDIRKFCSIVGTVSGCATRVELVVVAKVGYLGVCSIMGSSGNFIIKLLSATATDTVCDEGNKDGEDNQANNRKYTCNCAFVVKEPLTTIRALR